MLGLYDLALYSELALEESNSEKGKSGACGLVSKAPPPGKRYQTGVALTLLTTRIQDHYNVHCFTGDQTTTLACCIIKTKRGDCRELQSALKMVLASAFHLSDGERSLV